MLDKADFLLRDDIIFLNHGAFGACPKAVFERFQAWQLELERQPVDFLLRRWPQLLAEARSRIAEYLHVAPSEIVFVSNATDGLSRALRALPLAPGDEILTTDQEYGAVNRLLEFCAAKTGAAVVRHRVRLPYSSDKAFADALFADVSSNTRAIVISHITSPSSLIFPIKKICQRAREMGVMTIVDGAHAPGQVPLDLTAIGADVYCGNFHKWLCAPKGAAFLHARPEHHEWIEPLVISHGCLPGAGFAQRHDWQGTRDVASFLTVPMAIDYQRDNNWEAVRAACHELAASAQTRLCSRFGLPPLSVDQFAQMVTIPLPDCDAAAVQGRLLEEYRIEAPVVNFSGRCGIRVSAQAYNTADDIEKLLSALTALVA